MKSRGLSPMPSDLIRFWIVWHLEHHRLNASALARALGLSQVAIHHWMRRSASRQIPERHWKGIASFFDFTSYDEFLTAARDLHTRHQVTKTSAGRK